MYKLLLTLPLIFSTLASAEAITKQVEIKLVNALDDSRGYCLDIAGGQGARAPLNKGLQAHTCYHYKGHFLEDQSFDLTLIQQGQFKLPYFDICMATTALKAGSDIVLASCDQSDTQRFTLQINGNITSTTNNDLCLTVSATKKKEGRGGQPPHVMRPLSLQKCTDESQAYQAWETFNL